jgi:hypothetical protein
VHPSERYIAIPWWGNVTGGFSVSKDYGQTWVKGGASMSPGKMNLMEVMPLITTTFFLSQSSTIRVFTDETPAVYVVKTV